VKSNVKLTEFIPHLPAQLQEGLDVLLKQAEGQTELHRNVSCNDLNPIGEEQRTFVGYASTRTVDRDGEVVMPQGMDLSQFLKAPVLLWGHKWSDPPIGGDLLIENDGFGLKTKSLLADTALASDIWTLVQKHFLRTSSIGYIPLAWVLRDHKDYGSLMDASRKWPEWQAKSEPSAFITKAVLLEHSLVSVPANIDALITSVKEFKLETLARTLSVSPPPTPVSIPTPTPTVNPPLPPAPKTFTPRLLKTAEQVQQEYLDETIRLVKEEISRRLGRV
jgi:hypothetical protein